MYGYYISDMARDTGVDLDLRRYLPTQVTTQYEDLARYVGQYTDRYRYQLAELDETYTALAKALVLALIFKHYLVPAWNDLWAKGPLGSFLAIYHAVRDVSSYGNL